MTSQNATTATSQLIMDLTDTELRAVLLQLAEGGRGRPVQDATVAEISAVLTITRGLKPQGGTQ